MTGHVPPEATRRAVLTGICGAACMALASCGRAVVPGVAAPAPPPAAPRGAAPAGARPALAAVSDIPVGGGRIFPEYRVVVTRPPTGDLRAFTAICTHDGCALTRVADATIDCPCHGSRFAITDGSVVHGPAERALHPRTISVQRDSIVLEP